MLQVRAVEELVSQWRQGCSNYWTCYMYIRYSIQVVMPPPMMGRRRRRSSSGSGSRGGGGGEGRCSMARHFASPTTPATPTTPTAASCEEVFSSSSSSCQPSRRLSLLLLSDYIDTFLTRKVVLLLLPLLLPLLLLLPLHVIFNFFVFRNK